MMQDHGGQDGRRNQSIESLLSDKYSIHVLHITNDLCLTFFLFTVQVLFCSDPTRLQDGDQDGHVNHGIRENGL